MSRMFTDVVEAKTQLRKALENKDVVKDASEFMQLIELTRNYVDVTDQHGKSIFDRPLVPPIGMELEETERENLRKFINLRSEQDLHIRSENMSPLVLTKGMGCSPDDMMQLFTQGMERAANMGLRDARPVIPFLIEAAKTLKLAKHRAAASESYMSAFEAAQEALLRKLGENHPWAADIENLGTNMRGQKTARPYAKASISDEQKAGIKNLLKLMDFATEGEFDVMYVQGGNQYLFPRAKSELMPQIDGPKGEEAITTIFNMNVTTDIKMLAHEDFKLTLKREGEIVADELVDVFTRALDKIANGADSREINAVLSETAAAYDFGSQFAKASPAVRKAFNRVYEPLFTRTSSAVSGGASDYALKDLLTALTLLGKDGKEVK